MINIRKLTISFFIFMICVVIIGVNINKQSKENVMIFKYSKNTGNVSGTNEVVSKLAIANNRIKENKLAQSKMSVEDGEKITKEIEDEKLQVETIKKAEKEKEQKEKENEKIKIKDLGNLSKYVVGIFNKDDDNSNSDTVTITNKIDTLSPNKILGKIVSAETSGMDYQMKVAVAAVVLNRVNSPDFPDTIKEVVEEKGAFKSISNDYFNIVVTTETDLKATEEALDGVDPTNGALYYYKENASIPKNLTYTKTIAGYSFYK